MIKPQSRGNPLDVIEADLVPPTVIRTGSYGWRRGSPLSFPVSFLSNLAGRTAPRGRKVRRTPALADGRRPAPATAAVSGLPRLAPASARNRPDRGKSGSALAPHGRRICRARYGSDRC